MIRKPLPKKVVRHRPQKPEEMVSIVNLKQDSGCIEMPKGLWDALVRRAKARPREGDLWMDSNGNEWIICQHMKDGRTFVKLFATWNDGQVPNGQIKFVETKSIQGKWERTRAA